MSDSWIPAEERENLRGRFVPSFMVEIETTKLLAHAVEADRRIAQRDELLKDMAFLLFHRRPKHFHLDEFRAEVEAHDKYEALLEGTT